MTSSVSSICSELLTTYRTPILDREGVKIQKLFYDVSKKHRNDKKTKKTKTTKESDNRVDIPGNPRTTLMTLIYNHFSVKKPVAEILAGPLKVIKMWSPEYNKIIYLFGELHSLKVDCKNYTLVENYFYDLINTTDVFIDLFLEIPAYTGIGYDKPLDDLILDTRLVKMLKRFGKCVEYRNRGDVLCKLARVHYFDIRKHGSGVNDISYFRSTIRNLFLRRGQNKRDVLGNILKDKRVMKTLKNMGNPNFSEYLEYVKSQIYTNTFVKKELDRSYMKQEIINYMEYYITLQAKVDHKNFVALVHTIFTNKSERSFSIALKKFLNLTVRFNSYLPDIYTLSRIFKNFNVENDEPKSPSNVIVYGGYNHMKNLHNFLKNTGFQTLEETKLDTEIRLEYRYCVNMKGITQPLFSGDLKRN